MKITWINFLHFYQPPTANNETVIEAAEKSYKRIISALKRNPSIVFTINITGCLLNKLADLGYYDLIKDINYLITKKQIELTGSAAFHPILEFLPNKEIDRQIKINEQILKKYFGINFKPEGFFIPEAAYGPHTAKIVKKFNYQWLILDEISLTGKLNKTDSSVLYLDKKSNLKIIFRERIFSKDYVPTTIFKLIEEQQDKLIITGTDAELYGLRHTDFTAKFEKLLKRPEITTITISKYLSNLKNKQTISLVNSSWESTEKKLKKNLPYHLWFDQKNNIQTNLWQLANLAITVNNKYQTDQNFFWSRQHLDKGLASCTFWWASAHDFKLFSSISWNPDEIEKGVNELIRSIRALANPKTKQIKIQAEKLYIKIKRLIWQKHWHYYW
ncbi:MAG: hypothetical protein ABH818_02255 [Patescibacteria group bacterium]|nr:hypothetical protein [Patescibacteria group bacterium]MBU1870696.1 hypothetical protein [Patescibacteria group bacterium]